MPPRIRNSLAETGDSGTAYQDINGLQPGSTYTLSAWVSASRSAPATAQLVVYTGILRSLSDNVTASSPVIQTNPGWQLLSRSFTVGREGAIRIQLARGPGDGTAYWDDIHLSPGKELQ
jgi:hypothetical protein